jgi:hypothetical protein
MKHKPPQIRRPKTRTYVPDTSISSLPLGVFRIPPNDWFLSLRQPDGTREIRKVRGSLEEARGYRDLVLQKGAYTEAWLSEGKDHRVARKGSEKKETAMHQCVLGEVLIFDDEGYWTD